MQRSCEKWLGVAQFASKYAIKIEHGCIVNLKFSLRIGFHAIAGLNTEILGRL
jgi:hypothetical protein